MNNPTGIVPKGPRILIKPTEVQETFERDGMIVMPGSEKDREELGQTNGTVIAMGNGCYTEEPEPWCAVGDRIIFSKYAGLVERGDDGEQYRLIRDIDVIATRETTHE